MKKSVTFVVFLFFTFSFGQSKIKKAKSELTHTPNQTQTTSTSRSSSSNNSDYNTSSSFILLDLTFGLLKTGLFGKYRNEEHLHNSLSQYPYYDGESGNYIDSDMVKLTRFDIEERFMFKTNDLIGNHIQAKIRPSRFFYFKANLFQLFENDAFTNEKNKLNLFQFTFSYDRIRLKKFNLGWDLGINHIATGVNETGILFGLHADYFFNKNISVNANANWGIINNLPINTSSLAVRYHIKQFTALVGVERLKIASPKFNFGVVGVGIYL